VDPNHYWFGEWSEPNLASVKPGTRSVEPNFQSVEPNFQSVEPNHPWLCEWLGFTVLPFQCFLKTPGRLWEHFGFSKPVQKHANQVTKQGDENHVLAVCVGGYFPGVFMFGLHRFDAISQVQ